MDPTIHPFHPPTCGFYLFNSNFCFFIAGSPWKIQVIDPQSIRISSSGREIVPVNAPASFSIKCGSSPADQVTVSIKGIVAREGGCLVPCLCVHHRPQVWLGHSPGHCPCFTTRLLPFAPTEVQLVGFLALWSCVYRNRIWASADELCILHHLLWFMITRTRLRTQVHELRVAWFVVGLSL